jgi:hypothetical protein
MKSFKILVFFLSVSMFVSCSDSSDEDLGIDAEGSLTAKVDGNDFASLSVAVGATVSNGVAAIQGSNSVGEYIRINIFNYSGVGTYVTGDALTNTNSIQYGTIDPVAAWVSTFDLGSGTIEVTGETDTTITGTFSFTGINSNDSSSKTVTEGQFSATKQ